MRFIKLIFGLIFLTFIVACSPVNQTNYNKITNGMSKSQVIAILGNPTKELSGTFGDLSGSSLVWQNQNATITILIVNDKVQLKSFIEPNNNGAQKPNS